MSTILYIFYSKWGTIERHDIVPLWNVFMSVMVEMLKESSFCVHNMSWSSKRLDVDQ